MRMLEDVPVPLAREIPARPGPEREDQCDQSNHYEETFHEFTCVAISTSVSSLISEVARCSMNFETVSPCAIAPMRMNSAVPESIGTSQRPRCVVGLARTCYD